MEVKLKEYFTGRKLYGDDFSIDEIKLWYKDEEDSYKVTDRENYIYLYHALNQEFGFRYLPDQEFGMVLGFGSSYGDEFIPILGKINNIIIIEPSEKVVSNNICGKSVSYLKPNISGDIPFDGSFFDLIICFDVLHHIPNVTKVINEFYRCLKKGGFALIREPINAMGDWTRKREGLSKRERGIPLVLFRNMIKLAGFKIIKEQLYNHAFTKIIKKYYEKNIDDSIYNSIKLMRLDKLFAKMFTFNKQYYPFKRYRGPGSNGIFYVIQKV